MVNGFRGKTTAAALVGVGLAVLLACAPEQAVQSVDTTFSVCATQEPLAGGALSLGGFLAHPPGSIVLFESGTHLLFNENGCTWIRSGVWDPVVTRKLTAAGLGDLKTGLAFSTWESLAGDYEGDVPDDPALMFFQSARPGATVACGGECIGARIPSAVADLRDRYHAEASRVADGGTEFAGHVRYMVVRVPNELPDRPRYEWPLHDVSLRDVALDIDDPRALSPESARLTSTPLQAALLRQLRRTFLREAPPVFSDRIALNGDYALFLRDALPFEDAAGYIPY